MVLCEVDRDEVLRARSGLLRVEEDWVDELGLDLVELGSFRDHRCRAHQTSSPARPRRDR